jgi:serine/threonine protein kinase
MDDRETLAAAGNFQHRARVTSERWQQIKSVLTGAMEVAAGDARHAYLDGQCGADADLRARVESLLAQAPNGFDDLAEQIGFLQSERQQETPGSRRLGAYELLREIGRGGMGTVWLACRADQQFDKLVAVKLLKRGTDTDELLRRFQAERQILARLEHPNIARLLDAGTTEDDLPYFVMEYVDGLRLNEFIEQEKLSLVDRLRLFLKICGAIQFAHQNLVVHRDLKPGNILITPQSEPKLLDFGVAKLLAPDEDALLMTVAGQERFTPAYASPEQVNGEAVTTLSDVYTAGALLYEMLTDASAHRFSAPHPTPTELLRVVAHEEPARPSIAAADPATKGQLRGDLDNIILKALRKDPARRYASMGAFAADIQRHLDDKPVTARPDTFSYRAGKFVRRNKVGVAAAAVVVLILLAGIVGTTWQARVATSRFNDVRRLAHSVLFDYHDAIANLPGSTVVREKLVHDSLDYLDHLGKQAGNDLSLQREIAAAYLKIGDVEGQPNMANLGHSASALESYRKSLALWQRIVDAAPRDTEATCKLATVYSRIGEVLRDQRDLNAALEQNRKAVALMEGINAADNPNADVRECLAWVYIVLGDVLGNPMIANAGDAAGATENYRRGLEIRERLLQEDPTSRERRKWAAVAYQRVATMLHARDDEPGAIEQLRKGLEIDEGLLREDPNDAGEQRSVSVDCTYLYLAAFAMGDTAQAKNYISRAIELLEHVVQADPKNVTTQVTLASSYTQMLYVLGRSGDMDGAVRYARKALEIATPLLANDPANLGRLATIRSVHERMADLQLRAGDGAAALSSAREELELNARILAQQPSNTNARRSEAATHAQLGRAHRLIAQHAAAGSPESLESWRSARGEFVQSRDVYRELKDKGVLLGSEPAKLDQVIADLESCEVALR